MEIRKIRQEDFDQILSMMEVFYASDALLIHPDTQTLAKTLTDCIADGPYLEGFIMEDEDRLVGYGMVAKSYSTEAGGRCVWIEDIYVEPQYRGKGYGRQMMAYWESVMRIMKYKYVMLSTQEDETAKYFYEKLGYRRIGAFLPPEQDADEIMYLKIL